MWIPEIVITEEIPEIYQALIANNFQQGDFECEICFDDKEGFLCHRMSNCGHVFCQVQSFMDDLRSSIYLEFKNVARKALIRNVFLVTFHLKFKMASQILHVQVVIATNQYHSGILSCMLMTKISRDSIDFNFRGKGSPDTLTDLVVTPVRRTSIKNTRYDE